MTGERQATQQATQQINDNKNNSTKFMTGNSTDK